MVNVNKYSTKNGEFFFWSDLHYCHWKDFILKPRGFDNIEDANAYTKTTWNNTVSNNDNVVLLGDTVVGAGDKSNQVFVNLLKELNFKTLYICAGNHYAGFKSCFYGSSGFVNKDYLLSDNTLLPNKTVVFIPNYHEMIIDGKLIVLSHYPLLSWNEQAKGSYHLHGHCHGNLFKTPWIVENYYSKRVMDIGLEKQKTPLSFSQLKTIMDSRKIESFDHH